MGLLQNLAAIAVRKKVVETLESNCPPELKTVLAQLLADKTAVAVIQNFVMANLKTPSVITPESLKALELPPSIRALFETSPQLLSYLSKVAAGAKL